MECQGRKSLSRSQEKDHFQLLWIDATTRNWPDVTRAGLSQSYRQDAQKAWRRLEM